MITDEQLEKWQRLADEWERTHDAWQAIAEGNATASTPNWQAENDAQNEHEQADIDYKSAASFAVPLLIEEIELLRGPERAVQQPCGCIVCTCPGETHAHYSKDCKAHKCGTPECVFRHHPENIVYKAAPSYGQLAATARELAIALNEEIELSHGHFLIRHLGLAHRPDVAALLAGEPALVETCRWTLGAYNTWHGSCGFRCTIPCGRGDDHRRPAHRPRQLLNPSAYCPHCGKRVEVAKDDE